MPIFVPYKKPASLTFLKTIGYPKVARAVDLGVRRDMMKSGWSQAVKGSHKSPHTCNLQGPQMMPLSIFFGKVSFQSQCQSFGMGLGVE